ncbi:MAG TPA: type IV secretory system conjugative DNA transfer family protein [Sphingobium sp.]
MSLFDDFPRGIPGKTNRGALLGTASWSASAPIWQPGMIFLGLDDEGQEVGHIDDRHIVTVAGSRGGKGISVILPNLRRWPGSCTVLDPKGENATLTAITRAAMPGHKVAVVDPHGVAKVPDELRASFNPLDLIDANADDAIDIAAAIGDALMIDSGDGKDIHWTESARQIVEALILYVTATEAGSARSLVRVRQLLTKGEPERAAFLNDLEADALGDKAKTFSPFDALWDSMAKIEWSNEAVADVIIGAANSVNDMGENERGSVLSTARRNTKFIDSPWMRRALQGGLYSKLNIDQLKASEHGLSIYLCLPARFIPTHARFLRLVLNLILYRMEAQGLDQPKCGHPVIMVLDEFAAIGRLESIEKAAGLMAGYGVKLWTILQDLGQLKRHYKESWETFLGNAGLLQFFANSDMTTLEWLSKRLGQTEVIRETQGSSEATSANTSKSQSRTEQSGWTKSSGITQGQQAMADLSRLATQDGGSGLVPFLARSTASDVSHSQGQSTQEGQSGGGSIQQGDSVSSGTSRTETQNEGIHVTPLMTPNEIAAAFSRSKRSQIIIVEEKIVGLYRSLPKSCPIN